MQKLILKQDGKATGKIVERYGRIAHACDEAKGHTCSAYEVRLFSVGH